METDNRFWSENVKFHKIVVNFVEILSIHTIFSLSTVSFKFFTKKCPGKPLIPFLGSDVDILQAGQVTCVLHRLASYQLCKHLKQKACKHGRPTGSLSCSKQMEHARKSFSIFFTNVSFMMLLVATYNQLKIVCVYSLDP